MVGAEQVESGSRRVKQTLGGERGHQLNARIGVLHGLGKGAHGFAVVRDVNLIANLPILHMVGRGVPIFGAQRAPACLSAAIGVFHFRRRIQRLLAGPANADQRLRSNVLAEPQELIEAHEVRRAHPTLLHVAAADDYEAGSGAGFRPLLVEVEEAVVHEAVGRHADMHGGHQDVIIHLYS